MCADLTNKRCNYPHLFSTSLHKSSKLTLVMFTWLRFVFFHPGGRLRLNCWLCKTRREQTGGEGRFLPDGDSRLLAGWWSREIYEGGVISLLRLRVKQSSVRHLHVVLEEGRSGLHCCQLPIGSLWACRNNRAKVFLLINRSSLSADTWQNHQSEFERKDTTASFRVTPPFCCSIWHSFLSYWIYILFLYFFLKPLSCIWSVSLLLGCTFCLCSFSLAIWSIYEGAISNV